MLYCKSSGRRLLQHELGRVTCDSRDSRNMRLRESCVTLVKFDEILPLQKINSPHMVITPIPYFTMTSQSHAPNSGDWFLLVS